MSRGTVIRGAYKITSVDLICVSLIVYLDTLIRTGTRPLRRALSRFGNAGNASGEPTIARELSPLDEILCTSADRTRSEMKSPMNEDREAFLRAGSHLVWQSVGVGNA
jgi:hypothetical protein